MAWLSILIAGVLEVGWAIGLKYSDGFKKPLPTLVTILLMIASFWFLSQGVRTIPVGTGYAVWTGIGAAGTAIFGMIHFHDPVTPARVICLLLVIGGAIGLKLASGRESPPPSPGSTSPAAESRA
jgi:quaternary ammonium compound-resistance protein SugE